MKYQRLFIFTFLVLIFLSPKVIFAKVISNFDEQSWSSYFEDNFGDESFTDITLILRQDLAKLKNFTLDDTLPIIDFAESSQGDEPDVFKVANSDQIQQMISQLVKNVSFSQSIEDEQSIIKIIGLPSDIRSQLTDYKRNGFTVPILSLNKVTFYDCSFLELADNSLDIDALTLAYLVESTKRITSIDIQVNYSVPDKPLEILTFSVLQPSIKQQDIKLLSVDNNVAQFQLEKRDPDSILHVEGIDNQDHIVNSSSLSSYRFNQAQVDISINFYQTLLDKIDQKIITDKPQLLRYMKENIQQLTENLQQVDGQTITRMTYYFKRQPVTIKLFFKPNFQMMQYKGTINSSESPYYNNVIVSDSSETQAKGLRSESGELLVAANYRSIDYAVDQYYRVSLKNDGWNHKIYRLDSGNQTFEPQPFYMMNDKLYLQRWIIVNKEQNNNFINGLVDIRNHQLVLPLEYDYIAISEDFIIATRFNEQTHINNNEVYSSNNLKKLFSGDGRFTVDKNNFIVKNEICTIEEPNFYYRSSSTDNNNITRYCYDIYNIYDDKGQPLSSTPYFGVQGNFGQDNLLFVTTREQKQLFINRSGEVANINLKPYVYVSPFSEGFAAVKCRSNQLYGYINTKGKLAIPCLYSSADEFMGGSALVEHNEQSQLISQNNTIIQKFSSYLRARKKSEDGSILYYFFDGSVYSNKGQLIQ